MGLENNLLSAVCSKPETLTVSVV